MAKRKQTALAFFVVLLVCSIFLSIISSVSCSSIPAIEWQQEYTSGDSASNVFQTSDGGYVFLTFGWNHQMTDSWPTLYKVNSSGGVQWSKTFENIWGKGLIQLGDGGFVLLSDWNVYPSTAALIRTDGAGNIKWLQNFTGMGMPNAIVQAPDGGFALLFGGWRFSRFDQTWASLIKTDAYGTLLWNKSYNYPSNYTYPKSLIVTADGGYALLGTTSYNGTTETPNLYFWLVKTNSEGTLNWSQTYGEDPQTVNSNMTQNWGAFYHLNRDTLGDNEAQCFTQTSDGGFLISGYTYLPAPSGYARKSLLIKTDSDGLMVWNQTSDENYSVMKTVSDDGLILASSKLVKLNSNCTKEWELALPGKYLGVGAGALSVLESSDGSVVILTSSGLEATWNKNYFLMKTETFLPPPTPSSAPISGSSDDFIPILAVVAVIGLALSVLTIFWVRIKNKKVKA
jgi:hypothetical protein